mmetsp:Transcript_25694/g.50288  ORF Transcript_25694/g.50288 Transcript_25694/m.50288 type:complete len:234 (-) Transcript_25694:1089-1790(-)
MQAGEHTHVPYDSHLDQSSNSRGNTREGDYRPVSIHTDGLPTKKHAGTDEYTYYASSHESTEKKKNFETEPTWTKKTSLRKLARKSPCMQQTNKHRLIREEVFLLFLPPAFLLPRNPLISNRPSVALTHFLSLCVLFDLTACVKTERTSLSAFRFFCLHLRTKLLTCTDTLAYKKKSPRLSPSSFPLHPDPSIFAQSQHVTHPHMHAWKRPQEWMKGAASSTDGNLIKPPEVN